MTSNARSKTPCTSSAGRDGCFSDPTLRKGYTSSDRGSTPIRSRKKRLRKKRLRGDRATELDDEARRFLVRPRRLVTRRRNFDRGGGSLGNRKGNVGARHRSHLLCKARVEGSPEQKRIPSIPSQGGTGGYLSSSRGSRRAPLRGMIRAMTESLPHVVIVGSGFGGLEAARGLARAPVRITVVDRRNHNLFQPLLYQVATAALSPADIAYPIRSILRRQQNADVVLAEVVGVDPARPVVTLRDGATLTYDTLVVASGARHSYFGHEDWAGRAPGLKNLEDALEIRRRILLAFEEADRESDPERRRRLLTFGIVGGGPTGVELAGAISEIARKVLVDDFRHIDPREARVVLIEAGPRILPTYSPVSSENATAQLRHLGVEVRTGEPV